MRHADDDVVGAVRSRELDRLLEHRNHHVETLDRELLLAEERPPEVALEALHLGEPREQRLPLVGRERLAVRSGLDRVAEPEPLLVARDVLDLVGERPAVRLAQLRQRLGQRLRGNVEAQEARRDPGLELGRQPRLEPVGVERRITRRLGAERVDVRGEVAVRPVRLDEGHGGRDPAEEVVRGGLGGRRRGRGRARAPGAPLPPPSRESSRSRSALGRRSRTSSGLDSKRARHRVDGLRGGEVVGQQLLDEAAVEVVYLVGFHSASEHSVQRPPGSKLHKVKRQRTADPYRDLDVIDSRAPRFNQATVGLLALVAVLTGWWPILGLLAAQLAVGLTFGRRYCLPCLAYFELVQPRFGEGTGGGLAAAAVRQHRRSRRPRQRATLAYALGFAGAWARRSGCSSPGWHSWPPRPACAPAARYTAWAPACAAIRSHRLDRVELGRLRPRAERRARRPVHAPALQRLHDPGAPASRRGARARHRRRVEAARAGAQVRHRPRSHRRRDQLDGGGAGAPGGMIGSPEATTRRPPAS